jgi:hypothetical protein
MSDKPLKRDLPEYSPDDAVWRRLNARLDHEEFSGFSEYEVSDKVWQRLEVELDKKEWTARRTWIRVAAALVVMVGIAAALAISQNRSTIRHEVVRAETVILSIDHGDRPVSEILAEVQTEKDGEQAKVTSLLSELRRLEKDKALILEKMNANPSPHMQQLLMEIELDMADLVREISNEIR